MKNIIYLVAVSLFFIAFSCNNNKDSKQKTNENTEVNQDTKQKHSQDVNELQKKPKVANEVNVGDTTLTYKVSLGILPDLAYKGEGVKVIRVTKNRPGDAGGLRPDDIITEIDGKHVKDLIEYTKMLGKHKKGDSVILTLKRNGNTIKAKIVFD